MNNVSLTPEFFAIGILWYIVFLFSTTAHEASHALAAKLGGNLTAFHGGQVSLDPLPHIRRERFGMVMLPILSYVTGGWMIGWASADRPRSLRLVGKKPQIRAKSAWLCATRRASGPVAVFDATKADVGVGRGPRGPLNVSRRRTVD